MNPIHPPFPFAQRTFTVDAESEGQRLDVFLAVQLVHFSRSAIQRLIEELHVMVDGRSVRASHKLRAGERIHFCEPSPRPAEPLAQDIPLVVLYEDTDLIVVDKAAGLVVHPAPGSPDGTLVNALLHRTGDLSGIGGVVRPGIVHRLDKGTSGVMVVTKNDAAHRRLARQFLEHTTEKEYIAFVGRRPGAAALLAAGGFDTLFGRHPVHRKRFSSLVGRGKPARTTYRVLARFEGEGWSALKVEARPETGRTHQIRVHLADAGHPILGDKLYSGRGARHFPGFALPDRPALHAHRLAFQHPTTGRRVSFRAPLPVDLVRLERSLEEAAGDTPRP